MNAHCWPIFLRPLKCLWTGGPVKVSSSPEPGLRRPPEALEYEAGHILVFFPRTVWGWELSRRLPGSSRIHIPEKGTPSPKLSREMLTLHCLELLGRQTRSCLQLDKLDRVYFPEFQPLPGALWHLASSLGVLGVTGFGHML